MLNNYNNIEVLNQYSKLKQISKQQIINLELPNKYCNLKGFVIYIVY